MINVGLFIPCYVDALFPKVGVASYKLLRHFGLNVTYPPHQTCCRQPMANGGFERMSAKLANKFASKFSGFDYVVTPSASCAAFVRVNYPNILKHECAVTRNTMDIVEFIHDIVKPISLGGSFPHVVSVHNSCHGVRELGLSSPSEEQVPRFNKIIDLLKLKDGITVREPERPDECCGFGGMFSVEEPAVSSRMGLDKVLRHMATGAEYVTGADASCLMHMSGIAQRQGLNIQFKHVVEILAEGI